jgi:hypothetical protein
MDDGLKLPGRETVDMFLDIMSRQMKGQLAAELAWCDAMKTWAAVRGMTVVA